MKYTISINCGTIFLILLILKLTNIITWSWWWITAPLWIPAVLGGIVLIVWFGIVAWILGKFSD